MLFVSKIIIKHSNSKFLHQFKCNICNSLYIGKTKRSLLFGQYEHLRLSVFTRKALKYLKKDAAGIRKHCHQMKKKISVDNFEIVGTVLNNFHVMLKESLLILKVKPCLNIGQESMPLYLFLIMILEMLLGNSIQ